ncbi:MAG: hypothetical protein KA184_22550 [Candidatus Hydrogenedentes bacterium]|nr:hypothetical protein [Candidatus Hydrogenedentota bacterium]
MRECPSSGEGAPHLLSAACGIPPAALAALSAQWIESAEQVLAIAATAEGRAGLCRLLGMAEEPLAALLAQLRDMVGPEAAARLETPAPGGPLGARRPDEDVPPKGGDS